MSGYQGVELGMIGSVSQQRPGRSASLAASALLVVLAPLLGAAALAVTLGSAGPVLVQVPVVTRDGRLVYVSSFRIRRSFDAETHDRLGGARRAWLTPVGVLLHALRLDRLPALLDVQAGRIGFDEALAV